MRVIRDNRRLPESSFRSLPPWVGSRFCTCAGSSEFHGAIRRAVPRIHRISGRIFLVIGITSGVAAFVMTLRFPMWGALQNTAISLFFSVFMVFAFVNAFRHVKNRRFDVHREWMIRGFATGISVAFFRVLLNDVLPRMGMTDFDMRWNTVVAVSFPVLLGCAEFWIRATRPRKKAEAPAAVPEPATA